MPPNPVSYAHQAVGDTQGSVSSTASFTSSSPFSTSSSNSSLAQDPRMPVLPPQPTRRLTIEQLERQRRQQQELQYEKQPQQYPQHQRLPPSRSASKDIPVEEYDRESKEGRERLLAEYDRERAEQRDRLLHRKLDANRNSILSACSQTLQTMVKIDPTITEVSFTVTLTTVSKLGLDNNNSSKLSVTTNSKSTASAQDSQTGVSSSVTGPATFKNIGDGEGRTPSKTNVSYDPAPLVQPAPRCHAAVTGKAPAAPVAVSSSSLERIFRSPDSDVVSPPSTPAASLASSSGPSQEGETEISPRGSLSWAKRVRKRRIPHVDEYVLGEYLGKGTFAKVHKCKYNVDQKEYAMRIIPMKSHGEPVAKEEAIAREAAIMKKLRHPNIIEIKEFLHDPEESKWYMVLELCEGELLKVGEDCKTERAFSEDECRDYFHQLLLGMEYLHEHSIIHKDIKPANILISRDGILKIADFGISEEFVPGESMTISARGPGTREYMAPELFEHDGVKGAPIDIWSMGVTLFLMWNGCIPFHIQKRTKTPIFKSRAELKVGTPETLKALLDKLLEQDPGERITMGEMRENSWVTDNGRRPLAKTKKDNVGMEIKVTEEDKKLAFKKIRVLFAVAKAARMFKESLSRKSGTKVASMLHGIHDDATHLIVDGEGASVPTGVEIDVDTLYITNAEDDVSEEVGTSLDGDTSEDEGGDRFATCSSMSPAVGSHSFDDQTTSRS